MTKGLSVLFEISPVLALLEINLMIDTLLEQM